MGDIVELNKKIDAVYWKLYLYTVNTDDIDHIMVYQTITQKNYETVIRYIKYKKLDLNHFETYLEKGYGIISNEGKTIKNMKNVKNWINSMAD